MPLVRGHSCIVLVQIFRFRGWRVREPLAASSLQGAVVAQQRAVRVVYT